MRQATATVRECPIALPQRASVYSRALHRACLIVGGLSALAQRLQVDEPGLRGWIEGDARPPEHVFLGCIEIILLDAGAQGPRN